MHHVPPIRQRRVALGTLLTAILLAASATVAPSPAAASSTTPVMARSILTEDQLVSWWEAKVPRTICNVSTTVNGTWTCLETVPYVFRAGDGSVTPRQLIRIYLEEGARQGVSGDVAFMQAIRETAYFFYPDSGQVRPSDNNFAGMGAFDASSGEWVFRFSSVRDGVRAQLQHLRIYADLTVNTDGTNLGVPLVVNDGATSTWNYPKRWRDVRNLVGSFGPYHGSARIWEDFGNGRWATDPHYGAGIVRLHREALVASGYPADAAERRTWLSRTTASAGTPDVRGYFGSTTAEIVLACDWNGDGRDTPGTFVDGIWTITNDVHGNAGEAPFRFGTRGDVPLCGDWNGDGRDTVGVHRGREWILRTQPGPGPADLRFHYGRATDTPLVGDWNGDGRDTIGVRRGWEWILRTQPGAGPADLRFHYGRATDTPVTGNWNATGSDGIGVVR
jgi:hypothetical protein